MDGKYADVKCYLRGGLPRRPNPFLSRFPDSGRVLSGRSTRPFPRSFATRIKKQKQTKKTDNVRQATDVRTHTGSRLVCTAPTLRELRFKVRHFQKKVRYKHNNNNNKKKVVRPATAMSPHSRSILCRHAKGEAASTIETRRRRESRHDGAPACVAELGLPQQMCHCCARFRPTLSTFSNGIFANVAPLWCR